MLGCPFQVPLKKWAQPNSNSFLPVLFVATAIAMKMMDHHRVTGNNFTILLHTWYWSVRKRDILSKKGKLPVPFTFSFRRNQICMTNILHLPNHMDYLDSNDLSFYIKNIITQTLNLISKIHCVSKQETKTNKNDVKRCKKLQNKSPSSSSIFPLIKFFDAIYLLPIRINNAMRKSLSNTAYSKTIDQWF